MREWDLNPGPPDSPDCGVPKLWSFFIFLPLSHKPQDPPTTCTISQKLCLLLLLIAPGALSHLRLSITLSLWHLPSEPCPSLHPGSWLPGPPICPLHPKLLVAQDSDGSILVSQGLVKRFALDSLPTWLGHPLVALKGAERHCCYTASSSKTPVRMALSQTGASGHVLI